MDSLTVPIEGLHDLLARVISMWKVAESATCAHVARESIGRICHSFVYQHVCFMLFPVCSFKFVLYTRELKKYIEI